MPQTVSNPLGRGRGRHKYMKPNGVVNDYTPSTTLLNGACVNRAFPAVVNPPVGVVNGAKPCGMANGAWPAVHTAGVVIDRRVPNDCLAKGTVASGTIGLPNGSDLAAPEKNGCEASVQMKNRWQGKKRFWKKRNKAFVNTPQPPREVEDWEAEIVEVPPVKWGQTSYGTKPYGPEDKLGFVPQGLELCHMAIPNLPQTGDYSPSRYHPRPIKWSCYKVPTEPDQFADIDE